MYGQPNGFYMPNYNPYVMNNGAVPDMLNQVKMQYSQPIQQPLQPQKPTNDMLFVLNENEAGAYPVAPNNSVVLWDKNQKTFYIKTANAQGIPSMQTYDFTERIDNTTETPLKEPNKHICKCGDKFVTKDQFEALQGKLEALESKFEENAVVQVTKSNKTKKGDAE
jgi:hypothetical protein